MTENRQSAARMHDAVNKEECAGLGILYATFPMPRTTCQVSESATSRRS